MKSQKGGEREERGSTGEPANGAEAAHPRGAGRRLCRRRPSPPYFSNRRSCLRRRTSAARASRPRPNWGAAGGEEGQRAGQIVPRGDNAPRAASPGTFGILEKQGYGEWRSGNGRGLTTDSDFRTGGGGRDVDHLSCRILDLSMKTLRWVYQSRYLLTQLTVQRYYRRLSG